MKLKNRLAELVRKYKHGWVFLYIFYLFAVVPVSGKARDYTLSCDSDQPG